MKVFRRGGHPTMLTLPAPFGHEVTGTVVRAAAGAAQTEGDTVVVGNSAACGQCQPCRHKRENLCRELVYLNGAFADYMLIPALVAERSVHPRPPRPRNRSSRRWLSHWPAPSIVSNARLPAGAVRRPTRVP